MPGYSYMLYYPRFGVSGSTVYDLAGATYLNASSTLSVYGKGFNTPVITTDGRMQFSLLGTYGTAPSASSVTIMNNVSAAFTEPEGYYFVQVGAEVYDMVSAKDAKTWIRWQLY
jgi:4-aminobutyrate aminotransferase-like enzyme